MKKIQKTVLLAIAVSFIAANCFAALCGNGTCETGEDETSCPNDCSFIFSFWPAYISAGYTNFTAIDEMMATGMTHAGITLRPEAINPEADIAILRSKGYKIMQEISAGHQYWAGPEELTTGKDDTKFLTASCVDKSKCKDWNNSDIALDPSYTGIFWQNTINNTQNVVSKAIPDAVFFDTEIWQNPISIDWMYTHTDGVVNDCNCNVIAQGIGLDRYKSEWMQRGLDLKNIIKQANPAARVYFYYEIPMPNKKWSVDYKGDYWSSPNEPGYFQFPTGDSANPELYYLPNLEIFGKNIQDMGLNGSIATVSFSYFRGYSDFFYNAEAIFDPSVSREAGRMLRKAGAKGFYVYPNAYHQKEWWGQASFDRWINHAKEMIAGFKEGLTYIEKNKIANQSFEAFKSKADGAKGTYFSTVRFIPVYWSWTDTNQNYNDGATFANLARDNTFGTYSWKHSRKGDQGNRKIFSQEFTVTTEEQGDYNFSAWNKTNIVSANGKIKYYLIDSSNNETEITETTFKNSWNNNEGTINIAQGNYRIEILIEDKTNQTIDVYLDKVSLEKTSCTAMTTETLTNYISQWKTGTITMETLIEKIALWKKGC